MAVKSNGLALEAQTEDFVSLRGGACVTGLAINSQTEDLCVADSSTSGGIYLVDCKDASFTKLRKNDLWSTRVNIVRLAEPIRRCVRWQTQVFKIEGFVCKRFLPSPPPPPFLLFGCRFISRAVKTESPLPRYFFTPRPNGNACYAGYTASKTKFRISCVLI